MGQDLRGYLERVRQAQPEDFLVVSKEVDPAYELTAIVAKLEREAKKRPILLFENVKGTRFPVVTNLHASRSRLALALNVPAQELQRAYLEAMENPIAPKIVVEAPAKEVVLAGQHINLYDLPQIVHHEGDAAPYFTAAISFAKHPLDGTWNCAFNRLMVKGPRNTSIHLTPASHLWEFHRVAEAQGQSLPVAFAIGVHPAIALGALALGSIEEDERAVMGALLGKPLELIKCETSELLVPAQAELVIEAEILPQKRTAEGPFGEFTGYSLGERQREVVEVKALTHRRDAMFEDISVGHLDHLSLSTVPIEASLYRAVRSIVPSVRSVRVPAPLTCYVSIEQQARGMAKNAILAVLGADLYMKRVVVVDHDVDIFNDREVNWAIATRCQPDRDITVISNVRGSDLDPSTSEDGYTAKWGIDATAKPSLSAYAPRNRVPPEVWRRVDLKDFCG